MMKGPNANKWSSSLTNSDLVKGTVVLVNMNVPRYLITMIIMMITMIMIRVPSHPYHDLH